MSASDDFRRQLEGFGLTTALVTYHMPDYPDLLQDLVWQTHDLHPTFPRLRKFLDYWQYSVEGRLHSVTIAHTRLITPAEIRAVDGVLRLN
jgi:uncharacterized protein Usg